LTAPSRTNRRKPLHLTKARIFRLASIEVAERAEDHSRRTARCRRISRVPARLPTASHDSNFRSGVDHMGWLQTLGSYRFLSTTALNSENRQSTACRASGANG
jgi:hypothetical protein